MQLVASLAAASALVATAYAASAVDLNANCNMNAPHALVTNRCSYSVYMWSVVKTEGCPQGEMFTLLPGKTYCENLQWPNASDPTTGNSIKMSKTQTCGGADIAQLEYYLDKDPTYGGNYLDMSYIDCPGGNCPSRQEGFHMVAGNQTGKWTANSANTWCPVIGCGDAGSCDPWSYINPDDVQTRSCDVTSNMVLNLCGGEAPSSNSYSAPAASQAAPSSSAPATSVLKAQAAAVTPAAQINDAPVKVKTEVVYHTVYSTVNAKRQAHAHGHARRHARFHG